MMRQCRLDNVQLLQQFSSIFLLFRDQAKDPDPVFVRKRLVDQRVLLPLFHMLPLILIQSNLECPRVFLFLPLPGIRIFAACP